nr:molybdopterin cofactor-binding domain-containing protein [Mycobacterium sp. KBS0706]
MVRLPVDRAVSYPSRPIREQAVARLMTRDQKLVPATGRGAMAPWSGTPSSLGAASVILKMAPGLPRMAARIMAVGPLLLDPAVAALDHDLGVLPAGRDLAGHVAGPDTGCGLGREVAEDTIEFGDVTETHQQSTFGAHFVEAAVDAATGEIRVRRMLSVCAAGRILNPKAARSQVIGAMTMGVGAALMEELAVDKRHGFFVNHDLASYEVPVHADIPHQDMIFLDEVDPYSSPMKAKGVAELGICGVAAAVANAVHNATGVRVRHYPITLDKLLDRLPEVA